jgi:hypothetical protein
MFVDISSLLDPQQVLIVVFLITFFTLFHVGGKIKCWNCFIIFHLIRYSITLQHTQETFKIIDIFLCTNVLLNSLN